MKTEELCSQSHQLVEPETKLREREWNYSEHNCEENNSPHSVLEKKTREEIKA